MEYGAERGKKALRGDAAINVPWHKRKVAGVWGQQHPIPAGRVIRGGVCMDGAEHRNGRCNGTLLGGEAAPSGRHADLVAPVV